MTRWLKRLRGALFSVVLGLAEPTRSALQLVALVAVPLVGISALSASGSLLLARRAQRQQLLAARHRGAAQNTRPISG